jgi:hypothetical protein
VVAAALAPVMLAPAPARAAEPPPEPAADQRLKEVNLNPATLEDAFEVLRDLTHANIVVRWPALEKVGIERKRPVKLRLWDVRLGVVLDVLLDIVNDGTAPISWGEADGIITVSTADDIERSFRPTVYDVRDLIETIASLHPDGGREGGADPRTEAVDQITLLITESVAPDTWRDAGGTTGSIRELGGRLIITQSPAAKKKVEQLLNDLRRELAKPAPRLPAATQPVAPATSPSAPPQPALPPAGGPARSAPGSPSGARPPER